MQVAPAQKQAPEKEDPKAPAPKPAAANGGGGGGKKGKKDDKKHPQCVFHFKGHAGDITCSRVSVTGKVVCTAGEDRKIQLWNISALPPTSLASLNPELDHGAAIAMSPEDTYFAVAWARTRTVKIYPTKNSKDGAQVTFATKHTNDINDLIWSYSGRYLVTFACKVHFGALHYQKV